MDTREAAILLAQFEQTPDRFKEWRSIAPVLDAVNVLRTPPSALLISMADQALQAIGHDSHVGHVVAYQGSWRVVFSSKDTLVPPEALANE